MNLNDKYTFVGFAKFIYKVLAYETVGYSVYLLLQLRTKVTGK